MRQPLFLSFDPYCAHFPEGQSALPYPREGKWAACQVRNSPEGFFSRFRS